MFLSRSSERFKIVSGDRRDHEAYGRFQTRGREDCVEQRADLSIGKSTLGKWIVDYRPTGPTSGPQGNLARENERLRLENRILRDEREILKKLPSSSRARSHELRLHPWASA